MIRCVFGKWANFLVQIRMYSGSALFSVYCAVELSIRETPYQNWYKGVQKVAMCICSNESNSFDCHNQCYCLKWKDNKRSYLHKLCSHSNHNTNILLALPLCLSFDTILFTMEPFCIVGFILISIYTYVTLFLLACIWQSWFFVIVFFFFLYMKQIFATISILRKFKIQTIKFEDARSM